jgi:hypothetical protein
MNVETKYLRMIKGMKRKGRKDWTVYILRCGDGSLYTGIANLRGLASMGSLVLEKGEQMVSFKPTFQQATLWT